MPLIKNETSRGISLIQTDVTPLIVSSTADTTIFSYIITGGKMGTSKTAKFSMTLMLTTGLLPPTLTFRIRFGTSTLTVFSGLTLQGSLSSFPITVEGEITNMGITNSQFVKAKIDAFGTALPSGADWTIDTTADQTLSASVQFGAISSTTSIFPKKVSIELT